ncbi:MAG: hypothetical protein AB7I32_00055 [Gammaproteobacteria bacterium]
MTDFRRRVLTALALNRTPGFTFAGNYLGVRFGAASPQRARVEMDAGPHVEDDAGRLDMAAVCLLADIAMATVVRANLTPTQRLATVSMSLQFTGVPLVGTLAGVGEFEGFVDGADSRQCLCRVQLHADDRRVAFGAGAFMVMDPPPGQTMHPLVSAVHAGATALAEQALDEREKAILARADGALHGKDSARGALRRFWGFLPEPTATGARCLTANGPHLGNRVGHFQGGLQIGMALDTAGCALSEEWSVSSVAAFFLSRGEGEHFVADARIEHRGRHTAVLRTAVLDGAGRQVLVAETTHLKRGPCVARV